MRGRGSDLVRFNGEQRAEGGSMEMKEAWKIMARDEHDPEEKNDIIIII